MPLSCFVSDGRLHRLASLQPAVLLICQAFERAPVDDLNAGIGRIHTAKAQVHHHLFRCACCVLAQDPGLLQLLVQRVAVIGVPVKLRAPTIRPCLCVMATLTFTPNS